MGCSILAISISILTLSRVGCWCIGAWNILLGIGAFSGVVTFGAAFKADNIGLGIEVVVVSSWTVVVIGTVGVVWAVWNGGAWGLRWSISRLGCWWKGAGLLAARTF